jgi:predicted ester cyclase
VEVVAQPFGEPCAYSERGDFDERDGVDDVRIGRVQLGLALGTHEHALSVGQPAEVAPHENGELASLERPVRTAYSRRMADREGSDELHDALEDLDRALGDLELRLSSGSVPTVRLTTASDATLNKAVVERLERAFFAGTPSDVDALCDPEMVHHTPPADVEPTVAGLKRALEAYRRAFPGLRVERLEVTADGHFAASHWVVSGTHRGELFGFSPSGRQVRVQGMNCYRLRDGRITEMWTQFDRLALLQQLGLMPARDPLRLRRSDG